MSLTRSAPRASCPVVGSSSTSTEGAEISEEDAYILQLREARVFPPSEAFTAQANLGDPAVQPRYLGVDTLQGEPYHEIEVTFRQDGGGRDYEDRFIYWIHPERHTMDYLAYGFHIDDGGARFREATQERHRPRGAVGHVDPPRI